MSFRTTIAALALISFPVSPPLRAEQAAAPDFSEGFEKLTSLGMPELTDQGRWVESQGGGTGENQDFQRIARKMRGGGWQLPAEDEKKPLVLPAGELQPVPLADDNSTSTRPGILDRILESEGAGKESEPQGPDLERDINVLCKEVAKLKKDEDDYSRHNHSTSPFGPLLLFAAQLHQHGRTDLANKLAAEIFGAAPGREVVVDSAISTLGDHFLQSATQAFYQSGDWKSYHHQLSALMEKLPRGWETRHALALLMEPLRERAAGKEPPVPSLEGVTLAPEAIAAISWMLEKPAALGEDTLSPEILSHLEQYPAHMREQLLQNMAGNLTHLQPNLRNWLLEDPEKFEGPATPLLSLGVDALPVLAALVEDTHLIHYRNPGGLQRSYYYSSRESMADRALRQYAAMNRPATRGDIARLLLGATLPLPDSSSNNDPAALRETAIAFWKANRNASREGLAIAFIRDGSTSQKQSATQLLAASKDPAHHEAFEKMILDGGNPLEHLQNVQVYVIARKMEAKPFFDRYAKIVREELSDPEALQNNDSLSWELRQPGHAAQILKQLESTLSGESPQARARKIARGDEKEAQEAITALFSSLSQEPPRAQLLPMLSGALSAENPAVRMYFLAQTFQIRWQSPDQENPASGEPRVLTESEAKAWRTLIKDERTIPKDASNHWFPADTSLGDIAVVALENTIHPTHPHKLSEASPILRRTYIQLAKEHATARLSGKTPPALPDAEKITKERLAEIVSTAAQKQPAEIHPYLDELTPDERAAWVKWLRNPDDIGIPESVLQARSLIVQQTENFGHLRNMPEAGGMEIGAVLDPQSLSPRVDEWAANIEKHSRSVIALHPADFAPGLQLYTHQAEIPEKVDPDHDPFFEPQSPLSMLSDVFEMLTTEEHEEERPADTDGAIIAELHSQSGGGVQVGWWIAAGKAMKQEETEPVEFQKTYEALLASGEAFSLQFTILSTTDAARIRKLSGQEDEEE